MSNPQISWKQRRYMMWAMVVYSMAIPVLVLYKDLDSQVAQTAVSACFWLMGVIMLYYVAGASIQDIIQLRSGGYALPGNINIKGQVHVESDDAPLADSSPTGSDSGSRTGGTQARRKNVPKRSVKGGK